MIFGIYKRTVFPLTVYGIDLRGIFIHETYSRVKKLKEGIEPIVECTETIRSKQPLETSLVTRSSLEIELFDDRRQVLAGLVRGQERECTIETEILIEKIEVNDKNFYIVSLDSFA